MKKIFKKIIAVVMVVIMAVVCLPVIDIDNVFGIKAEAASYSGSMGGSVKWSYDTSSKQLTISGSGNMSNYGSTPGDFTKNLDIFGVNGKIYEKATSVVVNNGVTSIGNFAFSKFSALTSVTIAGSVKSIGTNSFADCPALSSVKLNSGLTSLGLKAFFNCKSLKSISVPATVKTLGLCVFEGCTSLSSISFGEGLTTIGAYCFKNTKYTNVILPSTVTSIGIYAFGGVSNPTFTCDYGNYVYDYCKANNYKYKFKAPILIITTSFNTADTSNMTVDTTLSLMYDTTNGVAVNAGNFTLAFNNSVIPVAPESGYELKTNGGVSTAIVYGTDSVGIAVMADEAAGYVTSGYETLYEIAKISFKVNGQADTADFSLTADTLMLNGSKITVAPAEVLLNLHEYDTSVIDKVSTCCEKGSMHYVCKLCQKKVTEEIPLNAANHSGGTENRNILAETCGTAGYTGDTYCLGCDEVIKAGEDIAATGAHTYESAVTVAATCNAEGVRTYTCTVCGNQYTETIAKDSSNHSGETETKGAKAETCGADGYTGDTYCKACGVKISNGSVISATGMHVTEIRNAADATCSTDGYTGDIYCTSCNSTILTGVVITATGVHDYTSTVTTAATCNSTGIRTYTCAVCEDTYTEVIDIDIFNHAGETEIRDAIAVTCGALGYTGDTYCVDCNQLVSAGTVVEPTGEHVTEVRGAVSAACIADGYTGDTYCTICDTMVEVGSVIPATGEHVTEVRDATEATCKADGYTGDTYCTVCGEKIAEGSVIAAGEHVTEVRGAVEATCKADGYTGDTYCTVCGEKIAEGSVIAATGEHITEVRDAVSATCVADGYTGDTYCTVCGEKIAEGSVIAAGEHVTEVRDATEATCKADGYTGDTYCTVCGEKIAAGSVIAATGEHITEVRDAVSATCVADGYTGDTYCTVCGEKIAAGSVIAAGGHVTEVRGAVSATCIADGYTGDTYCTVCGEKIADGETIAATGEHDYIRTVIAEPDCTTEGEAECICSVCGKSYIEAIAVVEHSYVAVVVEATCVTSGYTIYTCSECGMSYRDENVASLGHDYDENGECTRCDDVEITEIVIIQNNYIEVSDITVTGGNVSETPDGSDSTDKVVQVIISKSASMSASDFLAYVDGEGWSITDSQGNSLENDSVISTDCNISNAGGIEYKIVILGDINLDGTVTAADARLALRRSAQLDELSDIQSIAADVDRSDVINASDARVILRVSAKVETF